MRFHPPTFLNPIADFLFVSPSSGMRFNSKAVFSEYILISPIKMSLSLAHIMFMMGIPMVVRWHFILNWPHGDDPLVCYQEKTVFEIFCHSLLHTAFIDIYFWTVPQVIALASLNDNHHFFFYKSVDQPDEEGPCRLRMEYLDDMALTDEVYAHRCFSDGHIQ